MPRKPTCSCGECRKCKHRDYMRARYQAMSTDERRELVDARDKERVREYDRKRSKRPETVKRITANTKRWRKAHPDRARAHSAVAYAISKGRLVKQPCEVCGEKRVHAHHDDYSKPLEVRWLCALHHAKERAS